MYNRKNNDAWYIFLSILLVIVIILLSVVIYFLYNNKKTVTTVTTVTKNEPIQPKIIVIKDDKKDIPVYPKDLPKYNNKEYQQVGILTSNEEDKEPIILPLFSRRLEHNKDRYNYYTATDKNNMMRLPIQFGNMNCEDTIGCREIYDKDKIQIAIYKDRTFTATIYKLDVPQYFADKY